MMFSPARSLPLIAAMVVTATLAPAAQATTVTRLPHALPVSVLGAPDGRVQVLTSDVGMQATLRQLTIGRAGKVTPSTIVRESRHAASAAGVLLPDDGAAVAYRTAGVSHSEARAVIREHGVTGPAMVISKIAKDTSIAGVYASASGSVAVVFWQKVAAARGTAVRVAVRAAGAPAFGPVVDLPEYQHAFPQIAFNDAGDGVIYPRAELGGAQPSLTLRRIGRDGAVGAQIAVDSSPAGVAPASAALAPDGMIGLLWRRPSDGTGAGTLLWTTLASDAPAPAPVQRVIDVPAGDPAVIGTFHLASVGGRWIATVPRYAQAPTSSASTAALSVFEAAVDAPLAEVHAYPDAAAASIIGSATGGADLVWTTAVQGRAGSEELWRAHRSPSGAWSAMAGVLWRHRGPIEVSSLAARPNGGLAIAVLGRGALDHSHFASTLIRTND